MLIHYNVTGDKRKELVAVMRDILQEATRYLGAPIMQRNSICEEYR